MNPQDYYKPPGPVIGDLYEPKPRAPKDYLPLVVRQVHRPDRMIRAEFAGGGKGMMKFSVLRKNYRKV